MSIQRGTARTITFGSLTTAGAANTATTPTVVVSKDAGAQSAATNTPSHLGNGSWALALTAAEMTADLVSVTAYGPGLVPTYRELYTEADYTVARAGKVDNLDAAVSTRLASASYSAAPAAAAVADAVQARFGHAGTVTAAASGGSIVASVSGSNLSTTADFYAGQYFVLTSGSLANVARKITAYSAAAGSATFTFSGAAGEPDEPFPATPSAADGFLILGRG